MSDTPETREPLNEAVAVRVTATEKRAVQLIALLRDVTESELMRTMTMEQIVEAAENERRSREAAVA